MKGPVKFTMDDKGRIIHHRKIKTGNFPDPVAKGIDYTAIKAEKKARTKRMRTMKPNTASSEPSEPEVMMQ